MIFDMLASSIVRLRKNVLTSLYLVQSLVLASASSKRRKNLLLSIVHSGKPSHLEPKRSRRETLWAKMAPRV